MVRTLFVAVAVFALSGCGSEPLSSASGDGSPSGMPIAPQPGSEVPPADDYVLTEYPPGPYGFRVGSVIENLEFLGWHDPLAADYDPAKFQVVRLSDYYDPSGQSIKLIVLNASAVWCGVCRYEYSEIEDADIHAIYRAKGVQLIGALFEDINAGPATPEDLAEWGASPAFSVEFPLVLDPGFKLGRYFTSDSTPLNLIIDARTMQIVDTTMGYSPGSGYWQFIDTLLAR